MPAVISDRISKYKLETQIQIGNTNTNKTYKHKGEVQIQIHLEVQIEYKIIVINDLCRNMMMILMLMMVVMMTVMMMMKKSRSRFNECYQWAGLCGTRAEGRGVFYRNSYLDSLNQPKSGRC